MTGTVKQTLKNIDGAYLKAIGSTDNKAISMVYLQISKKVFKEQISKGARRVASITGFGYHEIKSHITNRAITLCLNELQQYTQSQLTQVIAHTYNGTLFDDDYMGQNIKFAIQTVKSWAYSDKLKQLSAEKDLAEVYDPSQPFESAFQEQFQEIRAMGTQLIVDLVANRADSKEFINYALSHVKEDVKAHFGLSEGRYNQKVERSLVMIKKNLDKKSDDYNYIKTLINSMIMTAHEDCLETLDEEIYEVYRDAISA